MATLRHESLFLRESLIASEAIDISDYDRCGRFTTDAKAALCGSGETPQFLFLENAEAGEPVSIAMIGVGQVALKLSATGSKGQKISSGSNGLLVAGTAASAEMDEDDFGIVLSGDWSDGEEVEVMIYPGRKV